MESFVAFRHDADASETTTPVRSSTKGCRHEPRRRTPAQGDLGRRRPRGRRLAGGRVARRSGASQGSAAKPATASSPRPAGSGIAAWRASTRRMKSVTIGLIIKAPVGDAPEANRFYAPVMAGIEELCRVRDIDLLFAAMPVDADYHPIEVPRLVTDRATDGLIIIGAHLSRGTASALVDWPPSILVDAYAEDASVDSVVSDNVGGARTAVEHLIAQGHRDIALVGARPDSFPSVVQRRRGYEQAMAEAELAAAGRRGRACPAGGRRGRQPSRRPREPRSPRSSRAERRGRRRDHPRRPARRPLRPARPFGGRLRRHRPRPVHHAAADDHGGRQARDGPARPDAAAPPARVPGRRTRPGGRPDGARRADSVARRAVEDRRPASAQAASVPDPTSSSVGQPRSDARISLRCPCAMLVTVSAAP